jgi:hypothetical protein
VAGAEIRRTDEASKTCGVMAFPNRTLCKVSVLAVPFSLEGCAMHSNQLHSTVGSVTDVQPQKLL